MVQPLAKARTGAQTRLRAWFRCVQIPLSRAGRLGLILVAFAMLASAATAQSAPDNPGAEEVAPNASADAPQPMPPVPLIALHGVVNNALSGDPLPRTLVQIDGETGPGALTDGDGRFDLNVPGAGVHVLQLTKPGFHDLPPNLAGAGTVLESTAGVTHSVLVNAGMPGLSFAMTPTGVIRGHIDLSTSEPAQGIGVILLRRRIQGGHAAWLAMANTRTNSDGEYRFAGLDEGDYVVATEPARESEAVGAPTSSGSSEWNGYAGAFYPDARDLTGASRIHVRMGETLQANLTLKLEPFHLVQSTVAPAKGLEKLPLGYAPAVLDTQGHVLSYPAQYDADSKSVQAMLPDGVYALQVTAMPRPSMLVASARNRVEPATNPLQGSMAFTVSGHPITNLHITLSERVTSSLAVTVTRNSAHSAPSPTDPAVIYVSVTQAGEAQSGGMWLPLAQGAVPADLETNALEPGSYWVHTTINQNGLCESSFTAGGASLAREPLIVGAGGATAALSLTLRDDCAALKLNLPSDLMTLATGEERVITVYVVPDFDSTVDVPSRTMRPSSGGAVDIDNLTPGRYHVYTFAAPVELEYRNPEALAHLSNAGQVITLEPSTTSTLTVEAPQR